MTVDVFWNHCPPYFEADFTDCSSLTQEELEVSRWQSDLPSLFLVLLSKLKSAVLEWQVLHQLLPPQPWLSLYYQDPCFGVL